MIFTPFIALPSAVRVEVFRQEVLPIVGRPGETVFSALSIEVHVPASATIAAPPGFPARPAVTWGVASATPNGTGSMVKPTPAALNSGAPTACAPSSAAGELITNAVTFLTP